MDSQQRLLHAMSLVPGVVNSIESLFGRHAGEQKREAALVFVLSALEERVVEESEIVNAEKFKAGLAKMIDGAVECLKASCWER